MKKTIMMIACAMAAMAGEAKMTSEETIASTLWYEARGEGFAGIDAVASVIANRAKKSGRTMASECLRPKQFSCWNGRSHSVPKKACGATWNYCRRVARMMVNGTFRVTNNATHYYNPSLCSPSWGKKMTGAFVLGNHRFGRC